MYVKDSESRMMKFKQCIEKLGDIDAKTALCIDVPTMCNEKWERVKKICIFLLSFYEITNMISATNYLTSNLYFLQMWNIQTWKA